MFLSLFYIIQSQRKISWPVVVSAAIVFLITVALIVYFFRRLRRNDQEPEEDWSLTSHSLFRDARPEADRAPSHTQSQAEPRTDTPPLEAAAEETATAHKDETRHKGETRVLASESPAGEGFARAEGLTEDEAKPAYTRALEAERPAPPVAEPPPVIAETERLSSPPQERAIEPPLDPAHKPAERGNVATLFDDEFWAGLEADEQHASPAPPAEARQQLPDEPVEPLTARVERRARLEPFEAPSIEPLNQREPFEPPRIEPIVPRNQPALARKQVVSEPKERDVRLDAAPPVRAAEADTGGPVSRPVRQTVAGPVTQPSGAAGTPATASRHARLRERAVSGSVLGLPAGASDAPMIYGDRTRRGEPTVDSLANYRKEADRSGGSWGTIALIITVVLVGGLALAYWLSPGFQAGVNNLAARVRGSNPAQTAPPAGQQQPKAQVIPVRRLEAVKNMVKARGAVDNISDETLDNLSLEVTLERNDQGQPETRVVPITPAQLAPRQRGIYEFEYDGNQETGFKGYRPSKLISNGSDVRFTLR